MSEKGGLEEQKCPVCNHDEMPVIERRGTRRRRECKACKYRRTTYEVSAERLEQLETIERHAAAIAEVMNDKETTG